MEIFKNKSPEMCHYENNEYSIGEIVPIKNPCEAGCRCFSRRGK